MKHSLLGIWSFSLSSLALCPSFADTTVPAQTVTTTKEVADPGKVTTATPGPVVIETTGKAVFIGGTGVVLTPGFWARPGSLFRASQDLNLGGFVSLTDTDFDGLPDAWELLHFGNLTAATGSIDSDGDGPNNAAEYYAGTNPNFNESTATTLPGSAQVVVKIPTGKFQKVMNDWSITNAP